MSTGTSAANSRRLRAACLGCLAGGAIGVVPATVSAADDGRPGAALRVEAAFSAPAGWVQAQSIYTLRLLQAVSFADPEFTPPTLPLAEIRPLGEPRVGELRRDGQRYRVVERRYAVFPLASGELVVDGASISGEAVGARGGVERRRLAAPPARLTVAPQPAGVDPRRWLPARRVTLSEHWEPPVGEARRGQPLTRTLRVEAEGVDAAQIPELRWDADGLSSPAGSPRLQTRSSGDWLVGVREQSWRVMPPAVGVLTLPTVRLDWWDAAAGRPRVAMLPARQLTVAAAAAGAAQGALEGVAQGAKDIVTASADTAAAGAPAASRAAAPPQPAAAKAAISAGNADRRPATPALAVAAAVAALLALVLAFRHRLRQSLRRAAAWRRLRRACADGDAPAAHAALLAWAALRHPAAPPRTLGQLATRLTAARVPVLALERHCYGPPGADWDRTGLLVALRRESFGGGLQAAGGRTSSSRAPAWGTEPRGGHWPP